MSDQKIIDLSYVKALKENHHDVTAKNLRNKILFVSIAEELINEIIGKSDSSFRRLVTKTLSKEVIESLVAQNLSQDDVLTDLNVLSKIERTIRLNPVVFSPGCTEANLTGWIAGFYMVECMFSSPEMDTEAKARAFNILLFTKMKDLLKA